MTTIRHGDDQGATSFPTGEPTVVLIHGGGWAALDRASVRGVAEDLAAAGHSVLNVEYRLAVRGNVAESLYDCVLAARDLARPVVLVGLSAGGHLALCAGAALGADVAVGVVGIGAPTVITGRLADGSDAFAPERLVRVFGTDGRSGARPIAAELRPIALARSGRLPPALLIHNLNDTVVSVDHARALRAASGGTVELCLYDGEPDGHGIWIDAGPPLPARHLVPEVMRPLLDTLARWSS
jgi:acetyl esterase/lipase